MNPEPSPKRDGVWTVLGLSADFVYIRSHRTEPSILRVKTAAGEAWAPEYELVWDTKEDQHETHP